MKKKVYLLLLAVTLSLTSILAQYEASWESLDNRAIPEWWSDAKFGIFIHWGLYSVPAYAPVNEVEGIYEKYAEHYYNRLLNGNELFTNFHKKNYGDNFKYPDFAHMFKAEYFNPGEWAELFKEAGAKYVVLTSKHHDGFCLWPSTQTPHFNSAVMGPHIDIIDTLSVAIRNEGLRFGLYYSLLEWAHPLYSPTTMNKWVDTHMIPQMKELVNNYKPEIIFSDGEWNYDSKTLKSEQFLAWLFNESPVKNSVVVNDRWGKETRSLHGDYYTTEYDLVHNNEGIGDKSNHPWEESRGIGTSYGYNRFETSDHYLTSKQLIHILIDKVSNGGNFLLNVGPDATGMIPVVMQERLLDIGKWLKVNGEAIYGSRTWKLGKKTENEKLSFTQNNGALYVILKDWEKEPIVISNINNAVNVQLLGYDGLIETSFKEGQLIITPPQLSIDEHPSQHAWVFKIDKFVEPQIIAHRGYWKTEGSAQNSIAALVKADEIGLYGSEVDIWLSSDGIPVVNHDADVTLNGEKLVVQETPFATLRKVKLANGEPLPTVEEYLDAFKKCDNIKLIMEFKTHKTKEREDELALKVIEMVKERDLQDKVEYISFGINFVEQSKRLHPEAPVYYLNGDLSPQIISEMELTGFDYHFNVLYKNKNWVSEAHDLGLKVNVWTVNKEEDIQNVINQNVDYITTDEPLLVKEILSKQ